MADWADNYHEYLYKDVEEVTVDVEIPVPLHYIELHLVLEDGDGEDLQPSRGVQCNESEGACWSGRARDLLPTE